MENFYTKNNLLLKKLWIITLLILTAFSSFSEGTKQIQPSSGDVGMLVLDAGWSNFAQYGCAIEERLQITICNPNERIYFGFAYLGSGKRVEYRIKDSTGNVVMGPANLPTSGAGYISSYNRAVNGPTPIVGTSGYTPLSYTAPQPGDYYLEFRIISGGARIEFDYFDITVASPAGNVARPGRVWSKSWMLSTGDYGVPFRGEMFVYADDGIVTSLDFNGMEPYVFVLNANKTGTNATNNPITDRRSQRGKATYPQYKVFLNDPDNSCFPTGKFGEITAPTTVTGCPPTNFCINVFVDRPGTVQIYLELNGTPGHQNNSRDRVISSALNAPGGCIPWDGRDGLGNFVTEGFSLTTTVEFYNGLTNIPLYDVERHPNGYRVGLVRPAGTISKLYWDDQLIPGGAANLNGTNSPSHTWNWNCCNNNANDYGNSNTINTWWYADSTRSITTNIVPPAIFASADTRPTGGANGKKDTLICGNLTTYQLSGQVINATGGVWSSTGTGTFTSTTSMNASYNITAADRSSGSVRIILTTTGNGSCPAVRDTLMLRFQPVPSANAGAGATVCANNPSVTLHGSVTNATGAVWSSVGGGTFSPSTTSMNPTYTPSAAEITAGSATVILTTTGNNKCSAAVSPVPASIIINPSPTVDAGPTQALCQNSPTVTLAGVVTNATSQVWSGGGGTYSPNNTSLNATYTPTAAEIAAGSYTLTLTASRTGCTSVSGNVTMTIQPSPTANAGANMTMCYNTPTIGLSGTVTNAASFAWTGGGGTFTPNNTTLNASYNPTTAERNAGSFVLTLTASRPGCTSAVSTVTITINPAPVVNAGLDGTVCGNRPQYNLSATSSTGSGTWAGLGTFFPNANTLNATYTPHASEISSGVAAIILSSTNNLTCSPVSDTLLLFITPPPVNNAGPDQSVCSNNPTVTLAGTASGSSSNIWSGGNGTYSPNTNTLNATYTPSAAEISAGSVTLTLTSNRATCNAVTDNVTISFTPAPTINAGADQNICYNNPSATLTGAVTVATGGTWSGGAGTFTPSNGLSTTYTPTATELNNGTITLILTSTGNNNCNAVTDTMRITVTPSPTVNAGSPQSVCGNNAVVTLNGSVTVATGGTWTGGAGTFSPNRNTLNATYTPTAAEITAGSVTLTLTTTGNGNCNPVTSNVVITYTAIPTANAGTDITICADNAAANLNGTVTQATGGTWSGGAGTYTPNNNTLTTTYFPTTAEVNAGFVVLTLTTTGNASNCNAVTDNIRINISPRPTANAGSDQIICSASSNVSLNGAITAAGGGSWSTSGSGTFSPNATTLNATYIPSAADKTAGSVTLTLTTTGMAPCVAVTDQMIITFTGVPSISAGPDQIACTNAFPIQLNGSGSPARWSGGSGTFNNINILNATYTPSAAEVSAGTVTLTLTTNPSGACPTVSDQITIQLPPAPIANAGADQTLCGNATGATLNGTVTNAVGGFWSTSGTGSFSPDVYTLNATYIPSALDKTNGTVTLSLATTGNGPCGGMTDQMVITIQPAISVTAGPDQNVCSTVSGFALNGASVQNATGVTWTTTGSGTFSPSATSVNPTYTPSAADISAGTVTLTITTTGNGICPALSDAVTYTIRTAPTINAGNDQTICSNTSTINLNGTVATGFGLQWSSSGTGVFTPNSTTGNATYTASPADITTGTITFTLTSTGNGVCSAVTDQMVVTINPRPTANAGTDQTVCGDNTAIPLNGTVTVVTGGNWVTSGDGTFANANSLTTTYTPGTNDIASGIVTLTLNSNANGVCSSVSDQVVINITPVPTVNAGPDQSICKNNNSVSLVGSVTIAGGGIWSGGAGSFNPSATDLNSIYVPTAAELTAGSVTLTLTTTNNGLCNAKTDQVVITFTNSPTIDAGNDVTVCADSLGIELNGSFTIATGATWTTSGTGNFFPNNTVANATYVPSTSDRTTGSVTLTYTTTGNGNCNPVTDQITITITPAPTVNAGPDQTVCGNNSVITLAGLNTVASGVQWVTSGTGTFANANSNNTTYTPSALDITAGNVTITLSTTGNGSCKPVMDQLQLNITPSPTVSAGPDQSVCANNPVVTLNGNVTVATGATWTTSGNGVFTPNNTTLNATYTPSPNDITTGNVTLTLTSTGNGLCNAEVDQMTITITPAPTVDAGTDKTICADATGVSLTGTTTVATGGIWTTNGTGIFTPNAATLNTVYSPSAADTTAKSVRFVLTTTGIGNCLAVRDTVMVTILPKPIINAGPDQNLCANVEFVDIKGSVLHATGATWTTSGGGFFTPDANTLTAQYVPVGSETMGGSITLTLTSTGHGTCNPVSDQVVINLQPIPSANAGPDQTVCGNIGTININGSITNATSGSWSSSGDGTFANSIALSTSYTPSADDIATGSVVLTLTTSGSGACNSSSDQLQITITPAPIVSAGNDVSVCANNANVSLVGVVTVATGGTWTSSGSGTFNNANSLTTTYTPSAADITAGSVTLTLTSTGNGSCNAVQDQLIVTITPAPTVNPGTPVTVCANTTGVNLNGVITVATGGIWSTASGTGTFTPSATDLNAVFLPSPTQIANGRATITLTTTGNGNCLAVSDRVVITIQPVPTVTAGPDVSVCTGTPSIGLSGTITNATGSTWTTSGTGTFSPNANTINANYIPSAADNVNGNSVTLTLTTTGTGSCASVSDQLVITFQTTPVSAGADKQVCSNQLPIQLNGSGSGVWSGGAGTFSDPTSLNTTYTPAASEIPGTVVLTLTGSAVGACIPSVDNITITIIDGPVATAGTDQSICSNNGVVNLTGIVTNATGGVWRTEGSGTFGSTTSLTTTYTASPADTLDGTIQLTLTTTGNGICPADSSSLTITLTPSPKVNAGSDIAACASASAIAINGTVTVAPGGTWTTNGTGTFANANNVSTTYTPSPADISAGTVRLTLTSSPVSNCTPVSDFLILTIGALPTAEAGTNQNVCSDAAGVNLNGSITVAGGGQWSSSGSGIFTPNNTTLNATYVPSAADIASTSVILTLTTTGNGNCSAASDFMTVNFTPRPTIDAGTDQSVCSDAVSVSISAAITVASGASWTTAGTGTFSNSNSATTSYNPSAADKSAGSVILTATTTGNGTCLAYSDFVTIFFTPTPTIFAGNDQSVCKDVTTVSLSASTTIATGGTWTTSGSGTFANANDLVTTYTPSAGDKTTGSVTLTVTSTGMGTCNAVTDQMVINFTNAPTVSAGTPRTICSVADTIHLSGSYTIANGVTWSSNGTGSFSPTSTSTAPIYYLSTADQGASSITLTLTTTGNGTCNAVSDAVIITISPKPVVNAGANLTICAGQANAVLSGVVTNAAGGTWTTTGTGTFNNANATNTTYIPSLQDFNTGGILLTLTSTGNGVCPPSSDVIAVNILPSPAAVVNAGLDQILCSDVTTINLSGFVSNAGGGQWSTSAAGTFNPNATTLEGSYTPTAADISSGTIVLTLATTNNGLCSSVSDDMTVTFTPAPTVTATGPASVCGDVSGIIPINGSFTVATGAIWSTGGTGIFAPSASNPGTTYYPSAADVAQGKVGLTLTTTGNGTCQPVSRTITVNITKPPIINAGLDKTVCASNTSITLGATVSMATGGTWTTSGTGSFSNNNTLNTTYTPSSADTTNKEINFTVTSTGNNGCNPVTDVVKVSFIPVPLNNAGADMTVCSTVNSINVNGHVANATGGIWTTNGTGSFTNPSSLSTSYVPSNADKASGTVTLNLQTTGMVICSAVNDNVVITIQPNPIVATGTSIICEVDLGAPLAGDVTNATGGIWTSTGTGVFAPDNADLNAIYYPSPADVTAGNVTLTLTSTGNGECAAIAESTILTIDPMPIANAGSDQFTCPGGTVTLAAQVSSGVNYNWFENGTHISTSPTINITGVSRTDYVLAVTDAKGCTSLDTVMVDIFTMPVLTLNPNYCLSTSLIIDGIPTPQPNVPGDYFWAIDGAIISGNNTPIISPIDAGQYDLYFAYQNCVTSASTMVNAKPVLVGGFIKDCINKFTDVTVLSNGGGYIYNWNTGQTGTDLNTINVNVVIDTTYYVATVTNPATTCSNKDSVRVIGIPTPILDLDSLSTCEGLSHLLDGRPANIANLDSLYPDYVWLQNNNPYATNVSQITVNTSGLYKEILTIGQCVTMDSAQVDFHVNPIINLPDYKRFCKPDDNFIIIDAGTNVNSTFAWTAPVGVTLDSSNTQSITVRNEGTYRVIITNEFDCSTTDSVFVDDLCDPRTDGPNVIIPGDPENGEFRIYGNYFKNYRLLIFNRWGEVIFESTNQMEGWDGTYLGQPMPVGVYPYVVTYDSEDPEINKKYKKEGSVTIIR